MIITYILLSLSLIINIVFIYYDSFPFFKKVLRNKLQKYRTKRSNTTSHTEQILLSRSMKLADFNKITTFWGDQNGITEKLIRNLFQGTNKEFKQYNYPKAFLLYGLTEYFKKNNKDQLGLIKKKIDVIITNEGLPLFEFDKVDQIPFGLASLNLYEVYKDEKYREFSSYIYSFLKSKITKNSLILYRTNSTKQLNDLIGMIVPFLVKYSEFTGNKEALDLAKAQLDYYIEWGVDKETFMPSHGIHLDSKVKVGSINWGRGIGWYLLGLSYYYKATGEYHKELIGLKNTLEKLELKNKLYSQFPGSNNIFDASTSTLFLYCFSYLDDFYRNKEDILNLFAKYIDAKGQLLQTSGDTYGLNKYSNSFGESELSQGILLLILAKY